MSGNGSPLASNVSIGVWLLGGTVPGGQRNSFRRILTGSVTSEACVGFGVAGVGICAACEASLASFCAAAIDLFASAAILAASFTASAQLAAFCAAAAAAASFLCFFT